MESNGGVLPPALQILGRLEGKVDALLQNQRDHTDRMKAAETRLSVVEAFQNKVKGWFVATALSGGAAGAALAEFFTR